jgi:hypothetical protein
MGKVYKDKKSKGCALCKPHKHGWAPKMKVKIIAIEKEMEKEISKAIGVKPPLLSMSHRPSQTRNYKIRFYKNCRGVV